MANIDIVAAGAALKELYDGQKLQSMVYKGSPFFAMIPKQTDFEGSDYPLPTLFSNGAGRSVNFTNAQTNQTAPKLATFKLTRASDYALATVTGETYRATRTDLGAFLKAAKLQMDTAIRNLKLSMSSKIFRAGTGSVAAIGSISSGVITLTNPSDVVAFEKDMVLQSAATDGAASRAALGYVINIDRNLGTVTVSATGVGGSAGSPASWAAADFLNVQGDGANGGANVAVTGLLGWLPTSAPSATAFFGVDRSQDSRLGGVRYNGTTQNIEEALVDASMLVGREGGEPDFCVMNYTSYGALIKSLGTKTNYVEQEVAGVGFKGVEIEGADSKIQVFPDRFCPAQTAFLLQKDTWGFYSAGEAPGILDEDGQVILRVSSADAYEIRVGMYGQLGCAAPAWNAVAQLSQ